MKNLLVKIMMWIIFLLFSLGGLFTKTDEAKTAKVADLQLLKPTVIRQYKPCTPGKSAGSKCVVHCSVTNAPDATLTIYNGTNTFSMIKVDDLNIDLILCMEVEHQDKNSYSCVVKNTHSSNTVLFKVSKVCEPCPDLTKNPVPVTEGESVTLHTNVTEGQVVSHVMWMFGCNPSGMILVAEILHNTTSKSDCDDGRFKDILDIDSQTGDLTITNISKRHSGVFKLQINNGVSKCWSFNVTVYALLPVPVITRNFSSSTDSKCSVLCSVANVSAASLSWYKGNSVLSSISVSDHSISLSLPLEVEYQDKNTYSCVVNNTIRDKTTHLNISDLCPGQSNFEIICVSVVGVFFLVLVIAAVIYFLKCYPTRKGAGSQDQTSQNPQTGARSQDQNSENPQADDENQDQNSQNPQADDETQDQTSRNPQTDNPSEANQVENESDPLIPSSSSTQESIALSNCCLK